MAQRYSTRQARIVWGTVLMFFALGALLVGASVVFFVLFFIAAQMLWIRRG